MPRETPAAAQTGKDMAMALPEFSMRQLLEAGVHYGHQTQRWNPKMAEYIYGERNGIHIIDLTQTVPMLDAALKVIRDTVAKGGRILFVGTKRQAQKPIAEAAEKCAQYYMNHRWLGGTLTNWKTVSQSIQRLKQIDALMADGAEGLTKKERLNLEREQAKLQASLGGIRDMGGVPDLLFVIDVGKEDLAVLEAGKLGIPVVAVVDTNCHRALLRSGGARGARRDDGPDGRGRHRHRRARDARGRGARRLTPACCEAVTGRG
jgi:small subunit ribosomal protein S2